MRRAASFGQGTVTLARKVTFAGLETTHDDGRPCRITHALALAALCARYAPPRGLPAPLPCGGPPRRAIGAHRARPLPMRRKAGAAIPTIRDRPATGPRCPLCEETRMDAVFVAAHGPHGGIDSRGR